MGEKFDFTLSKELTDDSGGIGEGTVFHAKLVDELYQINWEDNTGLGIEGVTYTIDEVEECINEGSWILIK